MAARNIGSLTIDLILRTVGLTQGASKSERELDAMARRIEKRAKMVGAVVGTALVGATAVVANQLRNTINQMDELSKAAQRANLPTEEFSKLAYAGDLADVAIQDLQSSLGRLAKAQAEAQKGSSQQARIFEALGIATKDAEGNLRSTYEVFLDFADAFKRNQGSPEIMAAGLNIFGRSFQNLVPLIKDGSQGLRDAGAEAERLGLVLSTEAGQAAEAFNDNLTRVSAALRGMWTQIASRSLPQLEQLSQTFAKTAEEANLAGLGVEAVSLAARTGTAIMEAYANAVARTSLAIETVANASAGFAEIMRNVGIGGLFDEGSVREGMRKVAAAFEQGQRDLDRLIERQNSPFRNVVSGANTVPTGGTGGPDRGLAAMFGDAPKKGGGKSDAQREAEQLQRSYESLMATMRERIALFNSEGEAAKVAYDLEHGALKALDAAKKQELITEAQRYDALVKRREADEAAYRLAQEETRRIQEGLEYGKQVVSDLQFELELMRMTNAERATAIQLRGMEAEAVAEYGDAIRELNRVIEEEMENARFLDGVRSEFSGFITDVVTGTESIKDAFKSMLDNIAAMITQRIAENWVEQLFGQQGSSGAGTSGGNWIGTIMGAIFGGGRASGGWSSPNSVYEVNERGLEMATVRGRDYLLTGNSPVEITPNHRLGSGGGASITQNFINPRMTNLQTDSQRAREEARKAQRAVARV